MGVAGVPGDEDWISKRPATILTAETMVVVAQSAEAPTTERATLADLEHVVGDGR